MQAGLIEHLEKLAYRLKCVSTEIAGGGGSLQAACVVDGFQDSNTYTIYLSIYIERIRHIDNPGEELTFASVAMLNPNTNQSDILWYEYSSSDVEWEIVVELDNYRLYARKAGIMDWGICYWECHFDAVRIYRDGTLVYDNTQPRTYTSYYFLPAGVPFLGMTPQIDCTAYPYLPWPPTASFRRGMRAGYALGGWRVRKNGVWNAYPVAYNLGEPWSSDDFPCGSPPPPYYAPSGNDTYNIITPAYASIESRYNSHGNVGGAGCWWEQSVNQRKTCATRSRSVPNLPRAYIPLSSEPMGAVVERHARPHVERYYQFTSKRSEPVEIPCDPNAQPTICEEIDERRQRVYDGSPRTTLVEQGGELQPPNIYNPYEITASFDDVDIARISYECCFPDTPNPSFPPPHTSYWSTAQIIFPMPSGNIDAGYYLPTSVVPVTGVAWYFNAWANPFWVDHLKFSNWSLGVPLTPVAADEYWRLLQQQWLGDGEIPEAKRTKQRNLCMLEPLTVSPYLNEIASKYTGYQTLWPGISRFDVVYTVAPLSHTLTSASQPRWSATDATLNFGASIQVTPTQATSTLEFDLTDWEVEPYLYPALCSAVRVQVTGVYDRVHVYLVNFEGDEVALSPATGDATKYLYVPGDESVYAGDWAQSYRADVADYAETGFDLRTEGRSSAVMSDPARRTLWELLHSQTPAKLRIVVEQTVPTPYSLAYPVFYREFSVPNNCKAYPLTAHTQAVIDHDALWRYGGLNFQLTTPVPQLRPVHQSPTVYDALCLRNLLYKGEAYQHQIIADANALYDTVEWTGAFADLRMDTRSLILPLKARNHPAVWLLINAYREVPPLACLPRRKRDENLAETGDWGQWQYLLTPLRRYHVGLETPIHLHRVNYDSSGNETGRQIITETLESFRRGRITYHALALNNDEVITRWDGQQVNSPRWHIHMTPHDWGRVTPFHGYSAVIRFEEIVKPTGEVPIDASQRTASLWLIEPYESGLRLVGRAYPRGAILTVYSLPDNYIHAWKVCVVDVTPTPSVWFTCQESENGRIVLASVEIPDYQPQQLREIMTMSGIRAIVEYWGERNLLLFFWQDENSQVQVITSNDYGRSWSSPQACLLNGSPLVGQLHDITHALHQHALYMTVRVDADLKLLVSEDGVSWQVVVA